jgi:DNA-binding NarL/FixJ family response regulator
MIRILLADDHALVRSGIRSLLERTGERAGPGSLGPMEVVAETSDGREAARLARVMAPDLAILDVAMPRLNGIEAVRQIRDELPATRVIMLSMHADSKYVYESLRAGAAGYVLKDSVFDELLSAIKAVMGGRTHVSPPLAALWQTAVGRAQDLAASTSDVDKLSPREREVLQLVGEGQSNREIADALGVSVRTVETHRENVTRKLEIRTVAGLTRFAIRNGLCSLEP